MKGFIYKYTFPDGKVYIGQTVRPIAARHREHTTPSTGRVNVGFWEAWEKYGDAKLEVIETVEEPDSFTLTERLNLLEVKYISQYRSTDPAYGYNRVPGGYGANASKRVLMKAFRKVFNDLWADRELFYEQIEEKIRHAFYKTTELSAEQVEFVSEVILPNIESNKRKYIKLTEDGKLSFRKARTEYNKFYEEEAHSWLMFLVEDTADLEADELAQSVWGYVLSNSNAILSEGAILKIDKDGTVIKEYASITEIMHELNLSHNRGIYNVLEGRQKTAYGYIWRWKNKK